MLQNLVTALLLGATPALAKPFDSMALVHNRDRALFIVNEQGDGKLAMLFDSFAPEQNEFRWDSASDDASIECNRARAPRGGPDALLCLFSFEESSHVQVGRQEFKAQVPVPEDGELLLFDLKFMNEENQEFELRLTPTTLEARSSSASVMSEVD